MEYVDVFVVFVSEMPATTLDQRIFPRVEFVELWLVDEHALVDGVEVTLV